MRADGDIREEANTCGSGKLPVLADSNHYRESVQSRKTRARHVHDPLQPLSGLMKFCAYTQGGLIASANLGLDDGTLLGFKTPSRRDVQERRNIQQSNNAATHWLVFPEI